MMQPTPSALRTFDPAPQPLGNDAARTTLASPLGGGTLPLAGPGDGVAQPWFKPAGRPTDLPPTGGDGWGGGLPTPAGGGALALISSLIAMVQQLVASLLGGGQLGGTQPGGAWPGSWPGDRPGGGAGAQRFADVELSSTGDPHLAEIGTRENPGGGTSSVDRHFDSMISHDDLVRARGVAGDYRVSTRVGKPDANGVTTNQSATVHADHGADAVTMCADGSFRVEESGGEVALAKGRTVTLGGGETVTENQDGSLVVRAAGAGGGSIATTLRANGYGGVDVTTHAHELAVGGDIVDHDAAIPLPARSAG